MAPRTGENVLLMKYGISATIRAPPPKNSLEVVLTRLPHVCINLYRPTYFAHVNFASNKVKITLS